MIRMLSKQWHLADGLSVEGDGGVYCAVPAERYVVVAGVPDRTTASDSFPLLRFLGEQYEK